MARRPDQRYATAGELAEDLEAFGRGEEPVNVLTPKRTRRIRWVIGAAAIVATGALIAAMWLRGPGAPIAVGRAPDPKFELVNATPGVKSAPSFSPDGRQLVYTRFIPGQGYAASLQNLATRDIVSLPGYAFGARFSPDGGSLAFVHDLRIAIRDLGKSTTVQHEIPGLTTDPALAWSPDGREILVSSRVGTPTIAVSADALWAMDIGSGRLRAVRRMDARAAAYSPHGSRIAIVSCAGGTSDIWTIPPAGGDAVRLTNDAALSWSPFWSADGRRVYFGSNRSGTPQLWRVGVDEASGRPVGAPELALQAVFPRYFSATPSADGKRMAFVSEGEDGRLFRFAFDSKRGSFVSSPTALGRHAAAATFPQPSPDGKWIVYTALTPEADLAIVSTDDSQEPRLLTSDEFEDRAPRWSPDGNRIAFHSNRSGSVEIWTIRPDGSDMRQVTRSTNGSAAYPVWSPDGTQLAYTVEGAGAFMIASGGSAPAEALPAQGLGETFEPWSWSVDGDTLAGSAAGIVVYSIRTRTYRRITDFGERPVWLHDGHTLLFVSERSIFIVDTDGGPPREIYSAAPSGLSPSLGVSADEHFIYASMTASADQIWIADLPR